ncbi:MAG: carbohydrate kinase [Oscillatoria sp. SIO1A7]|nr:carbohydrate kinase [Oscillatoria sp. SIO1A7]
MSYPRVLCLGEILFDYLADRLGQPYEMVESWTPYPGGAPANVACALVKLGTPAGFIGCVGRDESGESLVKLLQEIGVDGSGVQRHETAPTRQVYVVRSQQGDRSFAGFGKRGLPEFADPYLQAKQLPVDLFEEIAEFADAYLQAQQLPVDLFENAEFLVLGTLELAYPETRSAIDRALKLAEQYNIKVLLDINRRDMFWPNPADAPSLISELIKRVDFLKTTEEEATWLFGTADPGAITYRLGDVEGVLVTNGDKGCAYCLGENEGKLPAFSVDVADTTGAGDGFVAGIVHQICQQGIRCLDNPEIAKQIVTYASAVGGMTAMKPGAIAAQPTAAEVEAFLASH